MRDPRHAAPGETGRFRAGYTKSILLLCAAACALAVAVNVFAGQLPVRLTHIDTTDVDLYSISVFTEQVVAGLEEEVQIYLVAPYGREDSIIKELLGRYAGLGGRVKVRQVDPVLQPGLLAQYAKSLETNSVIVAGERRFQIISPAELYVENRTVGEGGFSTEATFAGEPEITGAISFVTSDDFPRLYLLTGHGEPALPAYLEEAIARENIDTATLNLGAAGSVPADADLLLLYAPERDLLEREAELLSSYLRDGGKLMLVGGGDAQPSPCLDAVAAGYGIERLPGTVVERNGNFFLDQYPSYVLANIGSHPITQPLVNRGTFILTPMAQGLVPTGQARESVSSAALLYTTDAALSVIEAGEGGQAQAVAQGPFTVGLAVEEAVGQDITRLVWFTSPYLLLDEVNELSSGANCDLFLNALSWMVDFDGGISIRPKSLTMDYLTIRPNTGILLGVVLAIVIPAMVLIAGGVMLRRRRGR